MEKTIYREDTPKRPIGRRKHPYAATDYEPGPQVLSHLRRMGLHRDYLDEN